MSCDSFCRVRPPFGNNSGYHKYERDDVKGFARYFSLTGTVFTTKCDATNTSQHAHGCTLEAKLSPDSAPYLGLAISFTFILERLNTSWS